VYGSVAIQLALALGLKVITTATNNNEFNYLQGLSAKIGTARLF
jgi:NADPH:quinone reductase-like Zn-dependent oxidoreductase